MKTCKTGWMLAIVTALSAGSAVANNLCITNISISGRDNTTALVKFDISWDNSWRYAAGGDPLCLHDAAWVFFKVKKDGINEEWKHVKLEGSGVNPTGFDIGTGTAIEMAVPADGVGMFLRRSSDGAGTLNVAQVAVVWNFASNGFAKNDKVKIKAFGIEMCYVAEGAFKVGDGLKDVGQLYAGGTGASPQPFTISSAGAIELADTAGKLWGAASMGATGSTSEDFPNGYNAFYYMKYLVTQGQYADFLNTLTRQQQERHSLATTLGYYHANVAGGSATVMYRNTIKLTEDPGGTEARVYTTETPDRAGNYVSWADLTAFAACVP